ncbi:MAG: glycerophosphodiester phosphodiesterase [Actinobacteria bacterium]|nr:glycerophosphodiester phosphodiesterase [Actinomycetota bacterium]
MQSGGAREGFRAYAHRGGAREAPENSLMAFRHASTLGFTHLETDIRPTRDGVAVLHHDSDLDRTTDGHGHVRDHTWQHVRGVRLSDGSSPLRLEELLEECPDAHVNVDVKEDGSVPALAEAIRRSGAGARVCVTSFSARRLARARRVLPAGVESSAHPWEVLALRTLPRGSALPRVQRVQVPQRALGVTFAEPRFVERAHGHGLAVDVWTVDDPADMERLLDLGVDGIMTDSPSVLREVLARRGIAMSSR